MNKNSNAALKLFSLLGFITVSVFADQYKIDISKVSVDQKARKLFNISDMYPQNDGTILGTGFNSTRISEIPLYRISSNGKIVSLGDIPHPDTKSLNFTDSRVIFTTNKAGVILVSYKFINEQRKTQNEFYVIKNGKWSRLPSFVEQDSLLGPAKIFIDEKDNVYFQTILSKKFYFLQNDSWKLMENSANDSQYSIDAYNAYYANTDSVYSTKFEYGANLGSPNIFHAYKFNKESINSTYAISLEGNAYTPVCTTTLENGSVLVAYANTHENLVKQTLKFDVISLNQTIDYNPNSTQNNNVGSLFGSIAALGKSLTNIVTTQNDNSKLEQPVTVGEIDLNPYLYGHNGSIKNQVSCTTIGNTSYFIYSTNETFSSSIPQYIYFKLTKTN